MKARAWAPPEIGRPKLLEIIVNGKVIRSGVSELSFPLLISKGEWIAARVTCENGAVAHTSPIYFLANGDSFRDDEQLAAVAARRMERLDFIETRLKAPVIAREYGPEEAALKERIAQARTEYQKLLHEAQK